MNEHSGYGQPTGTGTTPMQKPLYGSYSQPSSTPSYSCDRGYDYEQDPWNLSPWNSTSAKNFGAAFSDDPRVRHAGVGGGNLGGGVYYGSQNYGGGYQSGINGGTIVAFFIGIVFLITLAVGVGIFLLRAILHALNGVRR